MAVKSTAWHQKRVQFSSVGLHIRGDIRDTSTYFILDRLDVSRYIKRIIAGYLSNHVLVYVTDNGPREYKVTGGVPQGSVLGPLLWYIMYDKLLGLCMPEGVTLVAFEDDVELVIVRKHLENMTTAFSAAMRVVERWMSSVSLGLADHKIEALLITGRKKRETLTSSPSHISVA